MALCKYPSFTGAFTHHIHYKNQSSPFQNSLSLDKFSLFLSLSLSPLFFSSESPPQCTKIKSPPPSIPHFPNLHIHYRDPPISPEDTKTNHYKIMSTKSMRPPPRRALWHSSNPTTGSTNNTSLIISNTSKDNLNNNNDNDIKEKNHGFQRPKKPSTQNPKYDNSMMRTGSDPKKQREKKKKKKEEEEDDDEGLEGVNSQILAGYLAHEFLTKGTILGRKWGQRAEAHHEAQEHKYERYVQLAGLLKTDGAHLSGVVNPAQLARHLRLLN